MRNRTAIWCTFPFILTFGACRNADDLQESGAGGSVDGASGGMTASGGNSASAGTTIDTSRPAPPISQVSKIPIPPTTADVPQPSGTPDGKLTVIDWAGFKAAISYTFDDNTSSQIYNYGVLNSLRVPFTFFLWTSTDNAANSIWEEALLDGHELGNHTKTHMDGGSLIAEDTDAATAFIKKRFGVTPYTMAAPYGNISYSEIARSRFLLNRGLGDDTLSPNDNTDPFYVPCYVPSALAKASEFNSKVDNARANKRWQILVLHGFTSGGFGGYHAVDLEEFVISVDYARSLQDVWLDTMIAVGTYWIGQKRLTSLTPTTTGNIITWNWTLPDHFPKGKYVRVTVTGGTLQQGLQTLVWDPHGYYEVALDAKTLTLSP